MSSAILYFVFICVAVLLVVPSTALCILDTCPAAAVHVQSFTVKGMRYESSFSFIGLLNSESDLNQLVAFRLPFTGACEMGSVAPGPQNSSMWLFCSSMDIGLK